METTIIGYILYLLLSVGGHRALGPMTAVPTGAVDIGFINVAR